MIIYAHFDYENIIDEYVVFLIKALSTLDAEILFVSASSIGTEQKRKIDAYCKDIIVRENKGYDFYSYKVGLLESNIAYLEYDQIIMCNDSIYGPFSDLNDMFIKMDSKRVDFWGISASKERQLHIQSYFLVFNRNVIQSKVFYDFFSSLSVIADKHELINEYEIGLTQSLSENNFRYSSFMDTSKKKYFLRRIFFILSKTIGKKYKMKIKNPILLCLNYARRTFKTFIKNFKGYMIRDDVNPTHFYWYELLKSGSPFVKIDIFRKEKRLTDQIKLKRYLRKASYPSKLIYDHIDRTKKHYV